MMKHVKLIMLFCIGTLFIASKAIGQANAFINVLPSNSGVVTLGDTIDVIVNIGNTGPTSTIPQAKLRPIIQVSSSITFLPNASQTGLPAGWSILTNNGSQIRICNTTDPIPVNTIRTIILKAKGVTVSPPQPVSANINFGNGTTCAPGTAVNGDSPLDNSATSSIQVVAPVTLNLNVFISGYWNGISSMYPVLATQGQSNPNTDCDSITVELHDTNTPYGLLHSTVAVLRTDGTATAVFPSSVPSGNYYIVFKHRNSVETWSASPVVLNSNSTYNFTDAASKAFGSNQLQVGPNTYAIYSGDVNQDGVVDGFDILEIDSDIEVFASGYYKTDINGDGTVDGLDLIPVDINVADFIGAVMP